MGKGFTVESTVCFYSVCRYAVLIYFYFYNNHEFKFRMRQGIMFHFVNKPY